MRDRKDRVMRLGGASSLERAVAAVAGVAVVAIAMSVVLGAAQLAPRAGSDAGGATPGDAGDTTRGAGDRAASRAAAGQVARRTAGGTTGALTGRGRGGAGVGMSSAQRTPPTGRPASTDLDAMVAAERAFAAMAAAKGVRAAFLEYLAADSIGFQPALGPARAVYEKGPAPANPLATLLEWSPKVGELSASGDVGYLTGPFSIGPRDGSRPARYGCYFSIWKKQADGTWRVFIDFGVSAPTPVVFGVTSFKQGLARPARSGATVAPKAELDAADRALNRALGERGWGALGDVLSNDARVHREGVQPLDGRTEARRWLESLVVGGVSSFTTLDGGVASAGDLGYTYGRYETPVVAGKTTSGYYVRMWRREADDTWRVAMDVTAPS